ncbi:MAG TPA: hypothetical protein VHF47_06205 [Acidimicrobiales bacterium]|nr:hypothetical protein [Acidimicrobiales bacterium]
MACAGRAATWRHELARVLRRPQTAFLVVVGVAVGVLGVALDQVALIVLGVLILVLAAFVSVAADFKLAGNGLEVTLRDPDLRAEFDAFVETQRTSLYRLATHLCGEASAVGLVNEALARSFPDWSGDGVAHRLHLVCLLVRLATGGRRIGLLPTGEGDSQEDLYHRTLLLLRHDQDFDIKHIAAIVGRPPDAVRRDLAEAEAALV